MSTAWSTTSLPNRPVRWSGSNPRKGVNGARWLAGKNDNAFKASAFAGAFFCVDLLLVVVFCGEKQKKFSKSLDEKGENG